jgi:hypothetical protein
VAWPPSEDAYQAAITNGTAPGLYVREGDDTSDWETYRQVLARRVEEATAARRGDEVGLSEVTATRAMPMATTRQDDEMRPPSGGIAAIADVRKVSSPSAPAPSPPSRLCLPMPDGVAEGIEAALSDEVRRRSVVDDMRRAIRREIDRLYGSAVTSPPTTAASLQPPPSPPSRFSLLEVDVDTDVSPAPAPQALKAPVDLAALQQELRAEREAKRALAAAQTPPGRFDLLECDLPAIPATAAVTPTKASRPQRPAASSPPPRRPVETITDLTVARSPLELARMLEGLNDELSTMMRRREAN